MPFAPQINTPLMLRHRHHKFLLTTWTLAMISALSALNKKFLLDRRRVGLKRIGVFSKEAIPRLHQIVPVRLLHQHHHQ